jgi:hypothetical protein
MESLQYSFHRGSPDLLPEFSSLILPASYSIPAATAETEKAVATTTASAKPEAVTLTV